jgi:hypothetical protein
MIDPLILLFRALCLLCCWHLTYCLKLDGLEQGLYVHSDYLYLHTAPSTLSEDIMGVFATAEIQPKRFLCEYRGVIVPEGTAIDSKKMNFPISTPDGRHLRLIESSEEHSVCAHINDCAFIEENYTDEDIAMLERNEAVLPTMAGYSYNAIVQKEGAKVFIMSTRKIAKGEEIFYSYGRYEAFFCTYIE